LDNNSYLIQQKNEGLFCSSANLWIDPRKPVKKALISHAHFDHFSFGCGEYICSKETGILLKERLGKEVNINSFEYDETFKINGVNISFYPSGHILGSSQIKFEVGGEKWLITGDFKRQNDSTCQGYKKIETDFLICESTFGLPIFNWEPSKKIVTQIARWVNDNPNSISILFSYPLGKSQRILSEIENVKIIYTHKNIHNLNNTYKKLGKNLANTEIFNKDKEIEKGSLLILPPALSNKKFLKSFQNYQTGFASGWMAIRAFKKRSGYDKGFVISDHADWNGLISTIEDSKAKKIFLNHGDGEDLAKYLKNIKHLDIEALKN
tara:strand:- start:5422 stop:6390 length:969 start_codon:yes stop_codon:yes gene_type:complete